MRLARVQKQSDIENEVIKHYGVLEEKAVNQNEEMLVRLREKEKERREERAELRRASRSKGTIRIEEE